MVSFDWFSYKIGINVMSHLHIVEIRSQWTKNMTNKCSFCFLFHKSRIDLQEINIRNHLDVDRPVKALFGILFF